MAKRDRENAAGAGANANGSTTAAAAKKPKKLSKAAQARADAAAAGLPEMPDGALATLVETGAADARPAGAGRTKIVSWNVNGIRAMQKNQDRAEVLQAYMAAEQPDLLCIQETKLSGPSLDKKQEPAVGAWLAELLPDYTPFFNSSTTKKGYAGTAVLVKKAHRPRLEGEGEGEDDAEGDGGGKGKGKGKGKGSITSFFAKKADGAGAGAGAGAGGSGGGGVVVSCGIPGYGGKHDGQGRAMTVRFPAFTVVNSYVPNSGQKLEKLGYRTREWDADLRGYLLSLASGGKPVVWCGDLNVVHGLVDVHPGAHKSLDKIPGLCCAERANFHNLLNADGWCDTFRAQHGPNCSQHTFWGARSGGKKAGKGYRLDYFVTSPAVALGFESGAGGAGGGGGAGDGAAAVTVRDSFVRALVTGSDHVPIGLVLEHA